jgi:hypothetical protein
MQQMPLNEMSPLPALLHRRRGQWRPQRRTTATTIKLLYLAEHAFVNL